MKSFLQFDNLSLNIYKLVAWEVEPDSERATIHLPGGLGYKLTGSAFDGFNNFVQNAGVDIQAAKPGQRFVRVNKTFGFHTHFLFFAEVQSQEIVLQIDQLIYTLYPPDTFTVWAWLEKVQDPAPITHQATIW